MKKTKISIGILIIFVCGIIVGKFFVDQDGQSLPILSTANAQNSPTKALALDYMVWNVTKDKIKVRMGAKDEEVWPSPHLRKRLHQNLQGFLHFLNSFYQAASHFQKLFNQFMMMLTKNTVLILKLKIDQSL